MHMQHSTVRWKKLKSRCSLAGFMGPKITVIISLCFILTTCCQWGPVAGTGTSFFPISLLFQVARDSLRGALQQLGSVPLQDSRLCTNGSRMRIDDSYVSRYPEATQLLLPGKIWLASVPVNLASF